MKANIVLFSVCRTVLALGILGLLMTSCGIENKSISEPLSMVERNKLREKDSDYGMVFAMQDVLEQYHSQLTASEKATVKDLTKVFHSY